MSHGDPNGRVPNLAPQGLYDDEFSPRDPLEGRENAPLNRVYMRRQKDGSVLLYVSAHLDQLLLRAFRNFSFNGYMTDQKWIQLCIDAELYPRNKDPDILRHIFRGVASDGKVIEFTSFLRLLLRLARYKFRLVRNMSDEDALNALLVHLFCFPRLFLSGARLQECGIQATTTQRDACVGPVLLTKEQGTSATPPLTVASTQTSVPTDEKGIAVEPSVASVETMTMPPPIATEGTQTQPPEAKAETTSRGSMTSDLLMEEKSAGGRGARIQRKEKAVEAVFPQRPWPHMEACIVLEGGDDSDLYKVFCSCSEFDSESMQNLITERACAVLCKDSGIMEVPCHPKYAGVPPQQARQLYREVIAGRGRNRTRRGFAAAYEGTPATAEDDRSSHVWETECPNTAREDVSAAGPGDSHDPAQAVLEALENAEDSRLSFAEFKMLLYKFSRILYVELKPRLGFLKMVREKVVRNFFVRNKNVYMKTWAGGASGQQEVSDVKRSFGYDEDDDDAHRVFASASPHLGAGNIGLLSQASTRRPSKDLDTTEDAGDETNAFPTARSNRADPSPGGRDDRLGRHGDSLGTERGLFPGQAAGQFGVNSYGFVPYYMPPTMYPVAYNPGAMPTFPGAL